MHHSLVIRPYSTETFAIAWWRQRWWGSSQGWHRSVTKILVWYIKHLTCCWQEGGHSGASQWGNGRRGLWWWGCCWRGRWWWWWLGMKDLCLCIERSGADGRHWGRWRRRCRPLRISVPWPRSRVTTCNTEVFWNKGQFWGDPVTGSPLTNILPLSPTPPLPFAQGANATCFLSLFSEFMRILNPPRGRRKCKPCTFFENWYKVITNRAKIVSSHILVGGVTVTYGLRECSLPHLTYMWASAHNAQISWIDYCA